MKRSLLNLDVNGAQCVKLGQPSIIIQESMHEAQ